MRSPAALRSALLGAATWLAACAGSLEAGDPDARPGDDAPVCDAELAWFTEHLWSPLLSVQCVGCHQERGPASGTRMVLRLPAGGADEEANFRAVRAVALARLGDAPLLLLRPTLRHPEGHTGGLLVPVGSRELAELERFVSMVGTEVCDPPGAAALACDAVRPGARTLRRLSRDEYDRTVADLLDIDQDRARSTFAADTVVHGFDNHAASLVVSPLLADQLRDAAEALASEAVRAHRDRVAVCEPAPGDEEACARRSIAAFGERAFRRPLEEAELTRYLALWSVAAPDGFAAGLELVVGAMLQSPAFLYRSELGVPLADGYHLTSWEVASELSYLLWGTMPDDTLFEAARSGALDTAEGLRAEARRLVADPRARQTIRRFAGQWLGYARVLTVPKDGATYPALTPAVRAALLAEADGFFERALLDGPGRLPALLLSDASSLDPVLAAFHGEAGAADPGRRGALTLGAVLATHARPNGGSPVHRGKLVRERLLCQDLPPPPPGINAVPPPFDPALSTRERYRAHSREEPCAGCHRQMDPIGFAFERYDGIGRRRDSDDGHPIDASGELVGLDAPVFDGTAELATLLADRAEVHDCFVTQWFRFSYGVEEDEELGCLLRELQDEFAAAERSVPELLVALATSPRITGRRADDDSLAPAPAEPPEPSPIDPPDGGAAPGPAVDPGPPPPAAGPLRVESARDSEWPTGHCDRVTVTSEADAEIAWSITLPIDGHLTTHWNAEASADRGEVTFRGVEWNRLLGPGATAEFGYCAER